MTKVIEVYPFNISFDLFRDEEKAKQIDSDKLIEVLSSLNELEEKVMKLRYESKLTYKKIAEELEIDYEKVRRVRDKALLKLRHPSRVKLFKIIPYELYSEQSLEFCKLQSDYGSLKKAYEEVSENGIDKEFIEKVVKYKDLMDTNVSELGFSPRIYNALIRSGINTASELIKLRELDIISTRNLGEASLLSIKETLSQYGLSLSATLEETAILY